MKHTHLILGAISLSFLGCNIFDPSEEKAIDKNDAQMLVYEGQKTFREHEYLNAAYFFHNALAADSTKSEAWLGLSKSNLYTYTDNPLGILSELNTDQFTIPLMDIDTNLINEYYNAVYYSLMPLRELIRRDTMTAQNPSLNLSDRLVTYYNISASYAILEFAYTILEFRHNLDNSVKINIDPDGNIIIDFGKMYNEALKNSDLIYQFNKNIDNLKDNLTHTLENVLPSITDMLNESGFFDSEDETGIAQLLGDQTEKNAQAIQKTVAFYKVGDGIDNDGDGCVDEEILDGKDNDGDGLYDEDLRLVPITRAEDSTITEIGVGAVMIDHNMNGVQEDSSERTLNNEFRLLFAADFKDIYSIDSSMQDLRREIATDTDSNNIKYPLEERKRLIGRCWNNYSNEDFKAWFRNR